MTIYLFRHAETFESKNFIDYGVDNFKTPIIYEGREAIEKMAQYLKDVPSDFNVSSPFLRCQQTVEIITKITGKSFETDKRLGEYINISYNQFKLQLVSFLEEIKKQNYQNVLICTHGATMSVLLHLLLDKNPENNIPVDEYVQTGVLLKIAGQDIEEINFN